jgi:hypothetical protein
MDNPIEDENDQTKYFFTITATNENGEEMFSRNFANDESGTQSFSNQLLNTNHEDSDTLIMNLEVTYSKRGPKSLQKFVNAEKQKVAKNKLRMLSDSTCSDFTFIVKRRKFRVSKFELAAASPVFARMFSSAMKEAKTNEAKIDSIDPNIFEHLLRFIYGGKLPENLSEIAVDLFKAAHYYEIKGLMEICEAKIEDDLSVENVMQNYGMSWVFDMENLKADAWIVVKR